MLEKYSANLPQVLHFGSGVRQKAPELFDFLTGCRARVYVVCSKSVQKLAIWQELKSQMGERIVGIKSDIPHDPPISSVDEAIEGISGSCANAVFAIGGGSVMDVAKTAGLLANAEGTVTDYFRGTFPIPNSPIPVIAIPTTAGTGAEITKNAVLTDVERDIKASIKSPLMIPYAALCDPDFTLSLPKRVTADSGLDALTQAIESFTSAGANNLTRPLAAQATKLLLQWLPLAWKDGANAEARRYTAEGSMLTALAFSQSGLGAVHGLAHPIGHRLNTAHGFTCALLLPYIMAFNYDGCKETFDELARFANLKDGAELIAKVEQLCRELEVPAKLAELTENDFPYIVKNCRSGSMKANPRFMSDDDVINILNKLI